MSQQQQQQRRKTPIVSPRSENPWRPTFDQGTEQTQHLHDSRMYDSDASNQGRLIVNNNNNNNNNNRQNPNQQKRQSPQFPVNSLGQQAIPRIQSDRERRLDQYMKAPIHTSPSSSSSRPHQELLSKYIKHIDSDGEYHPSSNDQSANSHHNHYPHTTHQPVYGANQPHHHNHKKHGAGGSISSNSSSSLVPPSSQEYDADRSSYNINLHQQQQQARNNNKQQYYHHKNHHHDNDDASSSTSFATSSTVTPTRQQQHPQRMTNNSNRQRSMSPNIQQELSPAARAKRNEQFRQAELKHHHHFNSSSNTHQQQDPTETRSNRSPSISSAAIQESQRQHQQSQQQQQQEKEKLPSYHQAVKNAAVENGASPSLKSPEAKSTKTTPQQKNRKTLVSDRPEFFKKEPPRSVFYLAAAEQRNPLDPRENELRQQILKEEKTAAELLFRKIFGLLSYFWDIEKNKMIEEKNAVLDKVRNDPRYREQYEKEQKLRKKELKKQEKKKRRKMEKEEEERKKKEQQKQKTIDGTDAASEDGDYFKTLIDRLEKKTNNAVKSRENQSDNLDENTTNKLINNNTQEDYSSDVSTDPDTDDDDEARSSSKRSNGDNSSKNNEQSKEDLHLARLIAQAQRERLRAENLASEKNLLENWLALPSEKRFDPSVPIDVSLLNLGESNMRQKIEAVEDGLRKKLNEVFIKSLKLDWDKEENRHWQSESHIAREKESLDYRTHEHEEFRGRQMNENFNNILKLREKVMHGKAATTTEHPSTIDRIGHVVSPTFTRTTTFSKRRQVVVGETSSRSEQDGERRTTRSPSPLVPESAGRTPRAGNDDVHQYHHNHHHHQNQLVTVVSHHESNGLAPRFHPLVIPRAPVDD